MPVLAAFLGGLFLQLVTFFAQYVAKRFAITLAVLAATAAAFLVLFGAVTAALAGARVALPTPLSNALSLIAPTGFTALVSAWVAIELALAAYRWFKDVEKFSTNYQDWKL